MIKNRRQFEARLLEHLQDKDFVDHGYEAGGAPLYGYSYADQLQAKRAAAVELFTDIIPAELLEDYQLTASPQEFEYRVKMEFVISSGKFGMRKSRQFSQVIDLHSTPIFDNDIHKLVRQVYDKGNELGLVDYDLVERTGFTRYYVVKKLSRQELMLNIITSSESNTETLDELADFAIGLGFKSVNWIVVEPEHDRTFGPVVKCWGTPEVKMQIRDHKYLVGANTFTQNNIAGFEQILKFIDPYVSGAKNLMDLYCGIGTIGIQYADQVDKILAVDEVAESVELGVRNWELEAGSWRLEAGNRELGEQESTKNNATRKSGSETLDSRLQFITARVAEFLTDKDYLEYDYYKHSDLSTRFKTDKEHWDTIIVDPARPGLEGKVCRRLQKYFAAERIIYISCNPVTQKQDLERLLKSYRVVAARGFDLFPQTYHLENVVILEKIPL